MYCEIWVKSNLRSSLDHFDLIRTIILDVGRGSHTLIQYSSCGRMTPLSFESIELTLKLLFRKPGVRLAFATLSIS